VTQPFTTLRAVRGEILFLADHAARLGLDPGLLRELVAPAVRGLDDARVRVTLRPPKPPLVEATTYAPPTAPWRLVPVPVSHAGDAPLRKTTDRRRYDEARRSAGKADDALLVGPSGEILETTIANVFFLLPRGEIVTPPARGILPGIARGRVLGKAVEARLTLAEVRAAVACAVTNAVFGVHPVASLEGVANWDSTGLARDLREVVVRTEARLRIIER
jgi:para-aminobenzoate synthetase/4-amino-4-deoxychorismate lyase